MQSNGDEVGSGGGAGLLDGVLGQPCVRSVLTGTAIGATVGAGFHAIAGPTAAAIGQPNLRARAMVRQGSLAAGRLGSVFAVFTATRCGLAREVGLNNAIGSFVAGGAAGALSAAMDKSRVEFLQAYYQDAFKSMGATFKPSPAFVIGVSAFSGAVVFGGADSALRYLGLQW